MLKLGVDCVARNAPWFRDRGAKALSGAIAVVGATLFVVRLVAR